MSLPQIVEQSDDGIWGVVVAGSLPPGVARSKTRDDPKDALTAPWDPALTAPVGPNSIHKFVKVKMSDLGLARPRILLRPGDYANKKVGKFIPDYPHTCLICGGPIVILFSSQEHEGGKPCPGSGKPAVTLKRRR